MRILLTADPTVPVPPAGYGGIERIVDALLRAYRGAGHSVALLARAGSSAEADAVLAWPRMEVRGFSATLANARALAHAVRRFDPEIVHSFSRLAYLTPLLASRRPKIMSYQRATGGSAVAAAARLGRGLQFTGCSEYICSLGRRAGGDWRAIPNFVEPDRYAFVPSVPADAPLVFLSRIDSAKGPDMAIAVARACGRRLILAGNRPPEARQRRYWEKEIAPHLGRDGIEWVGEVGDREKDELLGRACALLVPVQWDEPFGIVFAEALACGTPILSCRRGALPEIVEEGRTGFLFASVAEGVAGVSRLGELDRAACRAAAVNRFSAAAAARQYLDLFREHLDRPG